MDRHRELIMFYKREASGAIVARRRCTVPSFTLLEPNAEPVDGWLWCATIEEAKAYLGGTDAEMAALAESATASD